MSHQPIVYDVESETDYEASVDSDFSSSSRSRRSNYFQSCVDRFRQLAAYVEHELGQPRRNWKDKITPWRNEQRDSYTYSCTYEKFRYLEVVLKLVARGAAKAVAVDRATSTAKTQSVFVF